MKTVVILTLAGAALYLLASNTAQGRDFIVTVSNTFRDAFRTATEVPNGTD